MKEAEYGSDDNNKHCKGAASTFWKVYDLASLLTAQLTYLSFRRHCNLSFLS